MKKAAKITAIIALCCLVLGLGLYAAAAAITGRLAYKTEISLDTIGLVKETVVISESFQNIRIEDVECDLRLLPAEDGRVTVVYTDSDLYRHNVLVKDNTLIITAEDVGTFWDRLFMISTGKQEVTVYLPFSELDRVSLDTVSGDVEIPGDFAIRALSAGSTSGNIILSCAVSDRLTAETVSGNIRAADASPESAVLSSTSGNVTLERASLVSLCVDTVSGEIILTEVTVAEFTDLSSISGSVHLNHMDSASLSASTVSGAVTGTVPAVKNFQTDTTSGSVYVSESHSDAPRWEISTVSGNIHISVEP